MSKTRKCEICKNYEPVYACVCGYSSLTEESGMPLTNQPDEDKAFLMTGKERRSYYEKGKAEGYHLGFDDGYKQAISDAAKVLEPMATHNEQAYSGNKDLARGYRHAIAVIKELSRGSR